jgi:hypothetical protein
LTSILVGREWSASRAASLTPAEGAPGTHWLGGWVGPRTGLDDLERRKILILRGLEPRPLVRPLHSQLLYQLHYPSSSRNIQCSFCRLIKTSRASYRQTLISPANWRSFIRWSPDKLVSQCYAIEYDRSFYCALFCVSFWLVWVKVQSACALNTRYY